MLGSVRERISVLLLVLGIVFVAGLLALRRHQEQQAALLARSAADERGFFLRGILDLRGDSLRTLASDYTFWDELYEFARHPDPQWARENLTTAAATFKVDTIWVFDRGGELVYTGGPAAKSEGRVPLVLRAEFADLAREHFRHFFVPTPRGVLEVRGATIHRSGDEQRTGPWDGYFFAGVLWDAEYRADLKRLTMMQPEIAAPGDAGDREVTVDRAGSLTFRRELPGPDGKPVGELRLQSQIEALRLMHESSARIAALALGFFVVVLGVLMTCLVGWVGLPLRGLTSALREQSPAPLRQLPREKTEFGELARLAEAFFEQHAALAREVEERTRAEARLRETLAELERSHWHLRKIQEVLPICMECGKVKTGERSWEEVVQYLKHNAVFISHGYCPSCYAAIAAKWGLRRPPEEGKE